LTPLYFEDFHAGDVFDCGTRRVTKEEILRFALEFDPQPYHTDEAFAAKSPFGGLIASGMHSASLALRLAFDSVLSRTQNIGSPGWDDIRFVSPLRAGATVRLVMEVEEAVPSRSRSDRGRIRFVFRLFNEAGETILEAHPVTIAKRRSTEETA
jgi:acyl dehydratase